MPTADLFVSLAKRGAALVNRQHDVLEAPQHREEDPQRLAGLFNLDHLAAQLRRNNNAALVLAGLTTIRPIHVPSVLSELALAAVSEVNGYQRVTVGAFRTRRVPARVAIRPRAPACRPPRERPSRVTAVRRGLDSRRTPHVRRDQCTSHGQVGDSRTEISDAALDNLNDMLAGRADSIRTGRGVGLVVTREIARRHALTVQFKRQGLNGAVVRDRT